MAARSVLLVTWSFCFAWSLLRWFFPSSFPSLLLISEVACLIVTTFLHIPVTNIYKKLSYRRETARQLYARLSRLAHWSCTSLNTSSVVQLYNRLAKVVSTLSAHKPCGQWNFQTLYTFKVIFFCIITKPLRAFIIIHITKISERRWCIMWTLEQSAVRGHLCSNAACFLQPSKDTPVSTFLPSRLVTFYPRPPVV